jgi:hypothetical protein
MRCDRRITCATLSKSPSAVGINTFEPLNSCFSEKLGDPRCVSRRVSDGGVSAGLITRRPTRRPPISRRLFSSSLAPRLEHDHSGGSPRPLVDVRPAKHTCQAVCLEEKLATALGHRERFAALDVEVLHIYDRTVLDPPNRVAGCCTTPSRRTALIRIS